MNLDEARKLIAGGESETVEFKASFDKEVLETAGAFVNTRGGTIFIGVADDGKIYGAQFGKETLKDWANQISQNSDPRLIPEIEGLEINEKNIIMIQIKEFPLEEQQGFRVTFRKDIYIEEYLRELGLNERQVKAVQYVREKGKITNREYRERFGVTDRTARTDLSALCGKNVFIKTGKAEYFFTSGTNPK